VPIHAVPIPIEAAAVPVQASTVSLKASIVPLQAAPAKLTSLTFTESRAANSAGKGEGAAGPDCQGSSRRWFERRVMRCRGADVDIEVCCE
jgi:hypothetical protein